MNNLRKFVMFTLLMGVCAAPFAFTVSSAQAQDYPKAGQYYPKAGNYPRAAGKSAPQAAPAQSSGVENSSDKSVGTSGRTDGVRIRRAGAKPEDKMYYDRYQKTMEAWQTVEAEIKGGQRELASYDGEVLKKNHRNIAVLWCMLHKEFNQTVKRASDGHSTIEDKTMQDIREWEGSLRYLIDSFEEELKSRGLEFDSYESIKREQGVRD